MTDEEKKAIEILKNKRPSEQMLISGKMCVDILLNLIEKQQKEIEKKDKIIDLTIEVLTDCEFDDKCQECTFECERDYDQLYQCNKEYFTKKVGE